MAVEILSIPGNPLGIASWNRPNVCSPLPHIDHGQQERVRSRRGYRLECAHLVHGCVIAVNRIVTEL